MKGHDAQCFDICSRHASYLQCLHCTLLHLSSSGTCKCHAQNGFGRNALFSDKAHEALYQNRGFACACRCDKGGGSILMCNSCCLLWIGGKRWRCSCPSACLTFCSLRGHSLRLFLVLLSCCVFRRDVL